MERKLFNLTQLTKSIPDEIIKLIDSIDSKSVPDSIFETIFESEEIKLFEKSIVLPEVEQIEKISNLKNEVRKKFEDSGKLKE